MHSKLDLILLKDYMLTLFLPFLLFLIPVPKAVTITNLIDSFFILQLVMSHIYSQQNHHITAWQSIPTVRPELTSQGNSRWLLFY